MCVLPRIFVPVSEIDLLVLPWLSAEVLSRIPVGFLWYPQLVSSRLHKRSGLMSVHHSFPVWRQSLKGMILKELLSFQLTAFQDGLATTFLIVGDHITIWSALLQGERRDHKPSSILPTTTHIGQYHPGVSFKEALKISLYANCTRNPCHAHAPEPKREIQRCQHCWSGSCF